MASPRRRRAAPKKPAKGTKAAKERHDAARRANGRLGGRPPSPRGTDLAAYANVAEVPKDVLARQEWAHELAATQLRQIAQDPLLTPKERRAEMRQAMRTMAWLTPQAAIRAALKTLRSADDERSDETPGAERQPVAGPGGALRLDE